MIVVVGVPGWDSAGSGVPVGRAAGIAVAAAAAGARVELVGRTGDDPVGDALLVGLARVGVGHAALLRDPARSTPTAPPSAGRGQDDRRPVLEAADVALGLRYLVDFAVLVVEDGTDATVIRACVDGAAYAGAHLVVLARDGQALGGLPDATTVIAAPRRDPDGAFARFVGTWVAALDRGDEARTALAQAVAATGWEAAPGD